MTPSITSGVARKLRAPGTANVQASRKPATLAGVICGRRVWRLPATSPLYVGQSPGETGVGAARGVSVGIGAAPDRLDRSRFRALHRGQRTVVAQHVHVAARPRQGPVPRGGCRRRGRRARAATTAVSSPDRRVCARAPATMSMSPVASATGGMPPPGMPSRITRAISAADRRPRPESSRCPGRAPRLGRHRRGRARSGRQRAVRRGNRPVARRPAARTSGRPARRQRPAGRRDGASVAAIYAIWESEVSR